MCVPWHDAQPRALSTTHEKEDEEEEGSFLTYVVTETDTDSEE